MTRARKPAQARVLRTMTEATAGAAPTSRNVRARAKEEARVQSRRTFARLKLQACANVFARSRIHFDARRGAAPAVASIDRARAPRGASLDGDDTIGLPPRASVAPDILLH